MTMSTTTQAKARRGEGRYESQVRRRLSAAAAVLALVLAGSAAAARSSSSAPASWAAPQIKAVTAQGLMGTSNPATFRPNQTLTAQALANLVFGLQQVLAPPPTEPVDPVDPVVPPADPTVPTDPTTTTPTPDPTTPTDTTPTPDPAPTGSGDAADGGEPGRAGDDGAARRAARRRRSASPAPPRSSPRARGRPA